ncbi:MAG: ATP-grasp domain-containing protein [Solobacterium sp.]|nr:ATP-grasp domain-containing protein [Solobacterium sp.]
MGKNFVFISPTFPPTYYQFPRAWMQLGGNALCIGEDTEENMSPEMRSSFTDYYRVDSLMDYDQVYRAVAYFAFKYGKIDWLESNNEFWLEQDAKLRTDFNIATGDHTENVIRFRRKSGMKKFYEQAGVPVARYHLASTYEEGKKFIEEVGYPIVAKPDNGVGANATWKISNDEELKNFYTRDIKTQYIMEEYIPGYIVSFDGITDQDNNIIFKTSHTFPDPIMNIVNDEAECYYWSEREIPEDLNKYGEAVIHAFNIKGRFFHTEYFRLTEDKAGLGKKGDLVGLEVNMRPPGGWTPDMMNYANDINVYQIYASMAMYNDGLYETTRPYHAVYVGRRDRLEHLYTRSPLDIERRFPGAVRMHGWMPELLGEAMGNEYYVARFKDKEKVEEFIRFVLEKRA